MKHALFIALFAFPAQAQESPIIPKCAPHGEIVAAISDLYGEKLAGLGRDMGGNVVEMHVGPKTWSALIIHGDGTACFASVGTGWAVIPLPPNL